MKIIITEIQHSLITEKLNEENLKKFCYKIWNKQKEKGEVPHIDDIVYEVSGIGKDTHEDFETIRPIWYEYNGGFKKVYDKLKEEILGETFKLVEPEINLDTHFKVVETEHLAMSGYKSDLVSVFCYVDNQGTIDFNFYDEENDEERVVNDTIEEAYYEAMSAYETGDLESSLNYYIFNYLTKKLEKYGIPIDVELELKTLD
jgi:hypothetical protein